MNLILSNPAITAFFEKVCISVLKVLKVLQIVCIKMEVSQYSFRPNKK